MSADKLGVVGLAGPMEFEAIRPHVLGKFTDMVLAVEKHPAMLLYLDQAISVGPNSPVGSRAGARNPNRKVGLNENLAREIMELHTLGVRSVYSQADVTEFARALTGWTVAGIGRGPGARLIGVADGTPGDFVFADRIHEPGDRTIIGKRYATGGLGQGEAILRDLAERLGDDDSAPKVLRERIGRMHDFMATLATWYDQVRVLPKPTLVALMKLGGRVARFLPGKSRS